MFISTRCCGCTEGATAHQKMSKSRHLHASNTNYSSKRIDWRKVELWHILFSWSCPRPPTFTTNWIFFLECPICSVLHLKQARSPRILTSFLGKPFPPNGWFISKILVLVDFQVQSPPWNLENFVPFVCVFVFFPVCFLVPSSSPERRFVAESRHVTSSRKRSLCLVEHWKVDKESWEWIILRLGGSKVFLYVFMLWIWTSYFWSISKNGRISPQNAWVLKYLVWKCVPYISTKNRKKREWIWPKKKRKTRHFLIQVENFQDTLEVMNNLAKLLQVPWMGIAGSFFGCFVGIPNHLAPRRYRYIRYIYVICVQVCFFHI